MRTLRHMKLKIICTNVRVHVRLQNFFVDLHLRFCTRYFVEEMHIENLLGPNQWTCGGFYMIFDGLNSEIPLFQMGTSPSKLWREKSRTKFVEFFGHRNSLAHFVFTCIYLLI